MRVDSQPLLPLQINPKLKRKEILERYRLIAHARTTQNDFPVTGGACLKVNSLPPTSDHQQHHTFCTQACKQGTISKGRPTSLRKGLAPTAGNPPNAHMYALLSETGSACSKKATALWLSAPTAVRDWQRMQPYNATYDAAVLLELSLFRLVAVSIWRRTII